MKKNKEIENEEKFLLFLEQHLLGISNQKLIVSDGDETISLYDTSKIFFLENNEMELWELIRNTFSEKGRNYEGYSNVAEIYSKIPYNIYKKYCENVIEQIQIRDYWNKVVNTNYQIIIVTAGLKLLWELIVNYHGWKNVCVIGGNNYNENEFIMTPELKGKLINALKKRKNKILAFGDSKVDIEMLKKSDMGVAVINERNSPNLLEELANIKKRNVYELKEKFIRKSEKIQIKEIDEILSEFKKLEV